MQPLEAQSQDSKTWLKVAIIILNWNDWRDNKISTREKMKSFKLKGAEKAIKAVYEKLNKNAKSHSIVGLLDGLKEMKIPEEFYTYARILT